MHSEDYNKFLNFPERNLNELLAIAFGHIQLVIEGTLDDLIKGTERVENARRNTLEIYGYVDVELLRYYDTQLEQDFLELDHKARSMDWKEISEVNELMDLSYGFIEEHIGLID